MLEEGLQFYHQAIPLAPSNLARAVTFSNIAMVNGTLARHSAFLENFDLALNEIGTPRPRLLKAMLRIAPLMARVFLLPRRRWNDAPEATDEVKKSLQQRIYFLMNFVLVESPGVDLNYATMKAAALAVSSGNRVRFVLGVGFFAGLLSMMGWTAAGRRQGRRTEAIAHDLGDAEARAEFVKMSAITHNGVGELQLANRGFREAVEMLEKAGVHWQATFGVHLLRHVQQVIGSSSEEIKVAERVLAMAQDTGDIRAQCWGQYDIACGLARAGDISSAKSRIEQARALLKACDQIFMTESIFLCTEGYVLLQASDYLNAQPSLQKSWRLCTRKFMITEYNARSLPLLIESIAGPEWTTAQSTERKCLKRLCRESRLLLLTIPNLHPHIHRARGRVFWTLGKRRKAIRSFERAIQCAERLGADYDRARGMLDLAAVQETDREELQREAIELLRKQESVIPRAESWLLGGQYDEAVVAPEFDLAAWEGEHGSLLMTDEEHA
jgi:tetratricopeptide (TPR) repeat protein